jgi:DHA1 family tetracycline resistance protein-like MFS transporter
VGLSFSIAGFVAFGLASQGWMMYAILLPSALGGIAGPATQALLSRQVAASEQGELQGSLGSLSSLTAIAGPLLGTALFARFAPPSAVPQLPGAPFFAAALLNVVGLLLAARLFARGRASREAGAPEG